MYGLNPYQSNQGMPYGVPSPYGNSYAYGMPPSPYGMMSMANNSMDAQAQMHGADQNLYGNIYNAQVAHLNEQLRQRGEHERTKYTTDSTYKMEEMRDKGETGREKMRTDTTRYGYDQNFRGVQEQANANRYGSDRQLEGVYDSNSADRYAADQQLRQAMAAMNASQYGSDRNYQSDIFGSMTQKEIAALQAGNSLELEKLKGSSAMDLAKLDAKTRLIPLAYSHRMFEDFFKPTVFPLISQLLGDAFSKI